MTFFPHQELIGGVRREITDQLRVLEKYAYRNLILKKKATELIKVSSCPFKFILKYFYALVLYNFFADS